MSKQNKDTKKSPPNPRQQLWFNDKTRVVWLSLEEGNLLHSPVRICIKVSRGLGTLYPDWDLIPKESSNSEHTSRFFPYRECGIQLERLTQLSPSRRIDPVHFLLLLLA